MNVHEVEVVAAVVTSIAVHHETQDHHQDVGVTMTTIAELLHEPTRIFHPTLVVAVALHLTGVHQVVHAPHHQDVDGAKARPHPHHPANDVIPAANAQRLDMAVKSPRRTAAKTVKIAAGLALLVSNVAHHRLDAIAAKRRHNLIEAAHHQQNAAVEHHHRQPVSAGQTPHAQEHRHHDAIERHSLRLMT